MPNGKPNILPDESKSVTSTPLVLAMPKPMATALGWPTASPLPTCGAPGRCWSSPA